MTAGDNPSIVDGKQKYLERLKTAVERIHHCAARHCMGVAIREEFQGFLWEGRVEVFDITGNQSAHVCYAWSQQDDPNSPEERVVAILGIPPIISPLAAVRASISGGAGTPE